VFFHKLGDLLGVEGTDFFVDVEAIGRVSDGDEFGTK